MHLALSSVFRMVFRFSPSCTRTFLNPWRGRILGWMILTHACVRGSSADAHPIRIARSENQAGSPVVRLCNLVLAG